MSLTVLMKTFTSYLLRSSSVMTEASSRKMVLILPGVRMLAAEGMVPASFLTVLIGVWSCMINVTTYSIQPTNPSVILTLENKRKMYTSTSKYFNSFPNQLENLLHI